MQDFSELPYHLECNENREVLSALPFFVTANDWDALAWRPGEYDLHSWSRRDWGGSKSWVFIVVLYDASACPS